MKPDLQEFYDDARDFFARNKEAWSGIVGKIRGLKEDCDIRTISGIADPIFARILGTMKNYDAFNVAQCNAKIKSDETDINIKKILGKIL